MSYLRCEYCDRDLRCGRYLIYCDGCKVFRLTEEGEAHMESIEKKTGQTEEEIMLMLKG